SKLWQMRGDIFGLGTLQVALCAIAIGALSYLSGAIDTPRAAVIVGLGLALSSTALVMQVLDERQDRAAPYGRKAFAILLFQDLAIVPLLLLVALLAPSGDSTSLASGAQQVGLALAAILLLILIGQFALNPMFRILANARMPEIMTAAALGVVIMSALLMDLAGMSYAMGSFIAGVMLAESSYRHEIEANVEPFRGLFMGLFFIAVGLSLDLQIVASNWQIVLLAAPVLMVLKGSIITAVLRLRGESLITSARTGIILQQAGEFGFVLFAAAFAAGLIDGNVSATLVAIITLTMALSPLMSLVEKALNRPQPLEELEETFEDANGSVLVIGFGRFGQIVCQPLLAEGYSVTILDNSAERIRQAARFGFRIHFGDCTRRDVLKAAGLGRADLVIVCVDHPDIVARILDLTEVMAPETPVMVRTHDRQHAIDLIRRGISYQVRETLESAFLLGERALISLGHSESDAVRVVDSIRELDERRLVEQVEGDIKSGMDTLHTNTLRPEPLIKIAANDE
ncbi:MAG: cation:proton antiporter, partial [Pseudomonadota bacterium]